MAEAVALEYNVFKAQMKAISDASQYIGPNGFCSVDDDDFMEKVSGRSATIMVLEPVKYRTGDSKTEYIVEYMRCGFSIYKKAKPGDYAANDAAVSECKAIARKIISRIRKNSQGRYTGAGVAPFRHFKAETISGENTKIELDGRIGYYCEFELHYQISLAYHTEDWTD